MEYSVYQLNKEELFILLDAFSDSYLSMPIKNAKKYFEPKIKGFRINKLPRNQIYNLYYNEISSVQNAPLGKHLITNMKECFDDAGISTLLKSFEGTVLELSAQLEPLVLKSKINVSPHTILLTCNYDCTQEELDVIKTYHQCIATITNQLQTEHNIAYNELKERTDTELQSQKAQGDEKYMVLEKLSAEKYKRLDGKYQACQNELNDSISDSERAKAEINCLNNTIIETKRLVDTLRHQLKDYDNLSKKVTTQNSEIVSLEQQIGNLNSIIQELKTKVLTPDDALQISKEIINDLKTVGLDDNELRRIIRNTFNDDMSIIDAWIKLGEIDNSVMALIFSAMKQNCINDTHVKDLDTIENDVYIRYIIIKSLKVLFFRFLEQNSQKMRIENHFKSEEE